MQPLLNPAPTPADGPPPPPPLPASGMSAAAWLVFPLALLGTLLGALGLLTWLGAPEGIHFRDSAAAVTYTTGAALVIERLIETGWGLLNATQLGGYWPMSGVATYVGTMVNDLSAAFAPFLDEAEGALTAAGGAATSAASAATRLQEDVATFRAEINSLTKLGRPGKQQSLLVSAATAQRIQYLRDKYYLALAGVEQAARVAGSTVSGLQNFVATFKDNPGRRIISLCLGGIIGVLVAAGLGLDLFQALSDDAHAAQLATPLAQALHITLTGLVIGLGSGPTHELISLIQQAKEGRKGANAAQPEQP